MTDTLLPFWPFSMWAQKEDTEKVMQIKKGEKQLDQVFYVRLLQAEELLDKRTISKEVINEVVNLYAKCVEYYDSIQDPIKIYFLEKIQITLSSIESLKIIYSSDECSNELANSTPKKNFNPIVSSSSSSFKPSRRFRTDRATERIDQTGQGKSNKKGQKPKRTETTSSASSFKKCITKSQSTPHRTLYGHDNNNLCNNQNQQFQVSEFQLLAPEPHSDEAKFGEKSPLQTRIFSEFDPQIEQNINDDGKLILLSQFPSQNASPANSPEKKPVQHLQLDSFIEDEAGVAQNPLKFTLNSNGTFQQQSDLNTSSFNASRVSNHSRAEMNVKTILGENINDPDKNFKLFQHGKNLFTKTLSRIDTNTENNKEYLGRKSPIMEEPEANMLSEWQNEKQFSNNKSSQLSSQGFFTEKARNLSVSKFPTSIKRQQQKYGKENNISKQSIRDKENIRKNARSQMADYCIMQKKVERSKRFSMFIQMQSQKKTSIIKEDFTNILNRFEKDSKQMDRIVKSDIENQMECIQRRLQCRKSKHLQDQVATRVKSSGGDYYSPHLNGQSKCLVTPKTSRF